MPILARFYGLIIVMHFSGVDRHVPHFHATFGEYQASFSILPLEVLAGKLPMRAERLVREWATEHEAELLENWRRAGLRQPLLPIEPLD